MKKFILSFALIAVSMSMTAIPAKKGVKKHIRLVDGTTVLAELKGEKTFSETTPKDYVSEVFKKKNGIITSYEYTIKKSASGEDVVAE